MSEDAGDADDSKPEWWSVNEQLRDEMNLYDYEPPRFEDGTYTHEIVEPLEEEYDCVIQFRSDVNPEYPEDWEVRVDYESIARVPRYRDESGNTVYQTTPEEFREVLVEYLEEHYEG